MLTSANYLNLIRLQVSSSPKIFLDIIIFLIHRIIFYSLGSEIRLFGSTDVTDFQMGRVHGVHFKCVHSLRVQLL